MKSGSGVSMPSYRVKITVQKKVDPEYIFNGKVPNQPGKDHPYPICHIDENEEWIVEKNGNMPEGCLRVSAVGLGEIYTRTLQFYDSGATSSHG
jgi:hypothetical protein